MNSFLFHLVHFYTVCNKFYAILNERLVLFLKKYTTNWTVKNYLYVHKYSITIRCRESISKHTLSIKISFGFPEAFSKRSLVAGGFEHAISMWVKLASHSTFSPPIPNTTRVMTLPTWVMSSFEICFKRWYFRSVSSSKISPLSSNYCILHGIFKVFGHHIRNTTWVLSLPAPIMCGFELCVE